MWRLLPRREAREDQSPRRYLGFEVTALRGSRSLAHRDFFEYVCARLITYPTYIYNIHSQRQPRSSIDLRLRLGNALSIFGGGV